MLGICMTSLQQMLYSHNFLSFSAGLSSIVISGEFDSQPNGTIAVFEGGKAFFYCTKMNPSNREWSIRPSNTSGGFHDIASSVYQGYEYVPTSEGVCLCNLRENTTVQCIFVEDNYPSTSAKVEVIPGKCTRHRQCFSRCLYILILCVASSVLELTVNDTNNNIMSLCCNTSPAPPNTSVDRIRVSVTNSSNEKIINEEVIQCQDVNPCINFAVPECDEFTATVTIFGNPGEIGMCSDSGQIGCGSTHFIWNNASDSIIGEWEE